MKHTVITILLLLLCCGLCATAQADTTLADIGVTAAFPSGWTVVTPDTVAQHFERFEEESPDVAAANMRAEGVYAAAFSASGDAVLRVIAREGDADVQLYHDIDRYSAAMRAAVKDSFLDRTAWELTGYRYTDAAWTNREGQGRLLNLTYSIRYGDETIARGLQAYTIRNGLAITLDLQVTGRQIGQEDKKAYNAFVAGTTLPVSEDAPLLPVGLLLTEGVPEETHKAKFTVKGESTGGATISAWLLPDDGDAFNVGQALVANSGVFKLDIELPGEGEWRLYLKAELDGYATSEEALWVDYDARRLPVTFTSYPDGDYYESQVLIEGKTIAGVSIQCMEGDVNRKVTTGSDGKFSIKMDRAILGERKIVLSLDKKNYDNRRFDIVFNRQWLREDYVKYLSSRVESLSFKNLTERPEKYIGRVVKYTGTILDISGAGDRLYIQLGVKQDKADGRWTERIIAVCDNMEVLLTEGDSVSLYFEVTGEFYAFSDVTAEGDEVNIDLPSVTLLTYEKHI